MLFNESIVNNYNNIGTNGVIKFKKINGVTIEKI